MHRDVAQRYRRVWQWLPRLASIKIIRQTSALGSHFTMSLLRLISRGSTVTARWVWDHLPFQRKQEWKNFAFKKFPGLFGWMAAYRNWASLMTDYEGLESEVSSTLQMQRRESGFEYVPLLKARPLANKPVRLICFYLPQFHPIPENNAWWGEGFTEWTNVRPAQPQFTGHYQPHVPGELGYYNLLGMGVQARQIELAKLYGIEGFCFYFYWFDGKRLLEAPIANYLENRNLDLPFCLCWANENWSRRWDGKDNEVLIAQNHSPEDDMAFINHIARYLRDPRYIRINGLPLLLVYRPHLLPSAKATAECWRKWCLENDIGEIYLAYTQSFEMADPAQYGFDAAIEFPPNNSSPPDITSKIKPASADFAGTIYDWRHFVRRSEKYTQACYRLFRSVCPGWDNTARRKNGGTIFLNSSPRLYRRWLVNAIRDTLQNQPNPDERLVFVNAWNEWAEGAYLEPDASYGYAYLQATRDALAEFSTRQNRSILLVTHDCNPSGAQFLLLAMARQLKLYGFDVNILALGGGSLFEDFSSVGSTLNAHSVTTAAVQEFLSGLRTAGVEDAIANSILSGSVLPQLKSLGFRVVALIHELPEVIRKYRQEKNAAVIGVHADRIIFPAELVRNGFAEFVALDQSKTIIRAQGVLRKNPYKYRRNEAHKIVCDRHGLTPDAQIVLSIAYVDFRKGADLFVEIANETIRVCPKAIFVWVGHSDQNMLDEVNQRILSLGLKGKVLFVGFDKDPLAYYAAASVYALTSREDPFPNVVLESAEVGVPVVAFERTTGAADFILEQGGRLAHHLDVKNFAECLAILLSTSIEDQKSGMAPSLQQYVLDILHYLNGFQRISVIVPNYNYERYIAMRLASVDRQSYPIYEVIVLDDASIDHSIEVIQKFVKEATVDIRLIINQDNSGSVFRQWQKGLALCRGDLVWLAEADDLAEAGFVEELTSSFGDPSMVLAYSQSKMINSEGAMLSPDYLRYTDAISDRWHQSYVCEGITEIRAAMAVKNTIPNVSAVIFRRVALEKAFAELGDNLYQFKVAGDWLLYLHVLRQGLVYFSSKVLNSHRRHGVSVTQSTLAEKHFWEVKYVQEYAAGVATLPEESRHKAAEYLEQLHDHFELPDHGTL